jgi:hypothetical protein
MTTLREGMEDLLSYVKNEIINEPKYLQKNFKDKK